MFDTGKALTCTDSSRPGRDQFGIASAFAPALADENGILSTGNEGVNVTISTNNVRPIELTDAKQKSSVPDGDQSRVESDSLGEVRVRPFVGRSNSALA